MKLRAYSGAGCGRSSGLQAGHSQVRMHFYSPGFPILPEASECRLGFRS